MKNPIFTFNLLPISILTTPNENWGRKVGVIKNLCVYDNGKGVKIVKKNIFTILHLVVVIVVVVVVVQFNTHNSLTGLAISTKLCEYIDSHLEMCIGILIFL